jgi:hypothetical protein
MQIELQLNRAKRNVNSPAESTIALENCKEQLDHTICQIKPYTINFLSIIIFVSKQKKTNTKTKIELFLCLYVLTHVSFLASAAGTLH